MGDNGISSFRAPRRGVEDARTMIAVEESPHVASVQPVLPSLSASGRGRLRNR